MKDNEKTKDLLIQELKEIRRMNLKLEKSEADRRHLEKALRESELLYHASFEQSPAVKLLIDPKTGEIVDANLAAAEFYGYQLPQLKSMKITDINMLPTDQVQAEMANAFTRQREVFIFRHRLATGEIRTVEVYSGPIQIGDRHLLHSIIHDITERKRAEEALQQSEQKFRLAFQTSPDAININRLEDGLYVDINQGFTDLTGFTREDVIGQTSLEIKIWHDPADRDRLVKGLKEQGVYENLEAQFRRKEGSLTTALMSARVLMLGEVPHILSITRDISERKQMEEELRKSGDVLGILVREKTAELARKNEKLIIEIAERLKMEQGLQESKKQMQILASKVLSAQEDERRRIALEVHDVLGSSLSAIKFKAEESLFHLPKDGILSVSKPLETLIPLIQETIEEARRIQADLRPSLLDDLGVVATLSWFCRRFQTIYAGLKVEQAVTIQEEEVPDHLKIILFRVVQEAMNNIGKYAKADSVYLGLQKVDGTIELVIKDKGEGFDLESLSSRDSSKKGLGLSSMKERVEFSGGSFSIESAEGKGTVIRAVWPA